MVHTEQQLNWKPVCQSEGESGVQISHARFHEEKKIRKTVKVFKQSFSELQYNVHYLQLF